MDQELRIGDVFDARNTSNIDCPEHWQIKHLYVDRVGCCRAVIRSVQNPSRLRTVSTRDLQDPLICSPLSDIPPPERVDAA